MSLEVAGGDLFTMVELEVNSRCNLRCSYCPVSIDPPREVPRLMPETVLERIFSELERLGFEGRISYHFYNEPLLHPELQSIVAEAERRLPKARQVLYTNGERLDDERYRKLISAGLDLFVVTSHLEKPVPPRPRQVVLMPGDLQLTNRGGALSPLSARLALPCFAPTTLLVVTVTGDVLLCYEDYYRSQVFGNVTEEPLDRIWYSERFVEIRRRLAAGDRGVTPICRACSNRSHSEPLHYDYIP